MDGDGFAGLGVLDILTAAYSSRAYLVLLGFLLAGVVWLLRTFTVARLIPDPLVAPVTVLAVTLGSIGAGLTQGLAISNAVETGVAAGFITVGGWNGGLKLVRQTWRLYKRVGGLRGVIPAWRRWWARRQLERDVGGDETDPPTAPTAPTAPTDTPPGSGPGGL